MPVNFCRSKLLYTTTGTDCTGTTCATLEIGGLLRSGGADSCVYNATGNVRHTNRSICSNVGVSAAPLGSGWGGATLPLRLQATGYRPRKPTERQNCPPGNWSWCRVACACEAPLPCPTPCAASVGRCSAHNRACVVLLLLKSRCSSAPRPDCPSAPPPLFPSPERGPR